MALFYHAAHLEKQNPMKILVQAKPHAKIEKVEHIQTLLSGSDASKVGMPVYKISVKAKPTDGRANSAIIRILSVHFKISRARIRIVSGHATSRKIVEINVERSMKLR